MIWYLDNATYKLYIIVYYQYINWLNIPCNYIRLFRDVNAALIVFDVRNKKSFLRAVSDQELPDRTRAKSWFKEVNHRCGDIPPVKILGKY